MSEGTILRLITVNAGVADAAPVLEQLAAMGLAALEPAPYPDYPGEIVDTTVVLGDGTGGSLSLVTPTTPTSSIQRFLDGRGPGLASVSVQVDDLDKVIERWSAAGIRWWQPEVTVYHDALFGDARAEVARVNWTQPQSLFGITFEVVEFQGRVERRTDWLAAAATEGAPL
jgi:hypothetical protein